MVEECLSLRVRICLYDWYQSKIKVCYSLAMKVATEMSGWLLELQVFLNANLIS